MRLIAETGVQVDGAHAVVVGRSNLVGKPIAGLLLAANATVTLAHSKTRDLAAVCRGADILVAAVGRTKMIPGSWIKPGAVVIDVGMNRDEAGKLCGDVDFDSAQAVASAITREHSQRSARSHHARLAYADQLSVPGSGSGYLATETASARQMASSTASVRASSSLSEPSLSIT
jgi:NAD(P)-dependent dehydrogenase (short-subunit alcohol dehydrogenase family)